MIYLRKYQVVLFKYKIFWFFYSEYTNGQYEKLNALNNLMIIQIIRKYFFQEMGYETNNMAY